MRFFGITFGNSVVAVIITHDRFQGFGQDVGFLVLLEFLLRYGSFQIFGIILFFDSSLMRLGKAGVMRKSFGKT